MLSVFELFKVGIGPSSSHTVGPMRAAKDFVAKLDERGLLADCKVIEVNLYGSLGLTGKGHGSGKAVILGLLGHQPDSIDSSRITEYIQQVDKDQQIALNGTQLIPFPPVGAINFIRDESLPKHPNGMRITATLSSGDSISDEYYSIGGGFIVTADQYDPTELNIEDSANISPFSFESASELLAHCERNGFSIKRLMLENEKVLKTEEEIRQRLWHLWQVMNRCIKRGSKTEGMLPGSLRVKRRAPRLLQWLQSETSAGPLAAMDWVNMFALAVNEENAAGGQVVTAPTNGAAGIIPAVLAYYDKFIQPLDQHSATNFLLTAGAIGILFKKNASISGAEVGCQGEVGVACSMAAAGLTELLGGTPKEVENAAEIGMEHNLGLTCDPIGGLVQVPCIERNAMGAIKAINAANIALRNNGEHLVSLDKVIKTMKQTGQDMKDSYKETSRGGLAVNFIDC